MRGVPSWRCWRRSIRMTSPMDLPRARRLDGLALALVGGDAAPPRGAEERASELLNRLARYRFDALAAYAQARPLPQGR